LFFLCFNVIMIYPGKPTKPAPTPNPTPNWAGAERVGANRSRIAKVAAETSARAITASRSSFCLGRIRQTMAITRPRVMYLTTILQRVRVSIGIERLERSIFF